MVLIHILIGAICASLIFLIQSISKQRELSLTFLNWVSIIAEIFYVAFVLELIVGFIDEGSAKAAVVMGSIFGLLAIIGAVLIWRFILNSPGPKNIDSE